MEKGREREKASTRLFIKRNRSNMSLIWFTIRISIHLIVCLFICWLIFFSFKFLSKEIDFYSQSFTSESGFLLECHRWVNQNISSKNTLVFQVMFSLCGSVAEKNRIITYLYLYEHSRAHTKNKHAPFIQLAFTFWHSGLSRSKFLISAGELVYTDLPDSIQQLGSPQLLGCEWFFHSQVRQK